MPCSCLFEIRGGVIEQLDVCAFHVAASFIILNGPLVLVLGAALIVKLWIFLGRDAPIVVGVVAAVALAIGVWRRARTSSRVAA